MRLKLGSRVDCSDGASGELAAVVVDPATRRVTHLVVGAPGEPWSARLVPVALVEPGDRAERGVELRTTVQELRELPPARDVGYPHLGDFPLDDPDWDVGIQDVYAPPSSASNDLQPQASESPVVYDRIPKGEVEIRRSSGVFSPTGATSGTSTASSSTATSSLRTSSWSAGTSGAGARSPSPPPRSRSSRPTT